ncbi:Chemotaxis protein methyltransferase [Jannaschia seosinensis]|uniref:protein-glutamate O-methyltransferase n=1 Tax=Jannaschia seosinensis TaxID=313367 RepID=A0A0M7BD42_9RHOB|nr:protein-glutamate O-methyltransferase CheR [Jannaschia seosinensis]CUH39823.1 Chemotaxis protein methyltransferase [Jannaschia seosinensis]
MLHQVVKTRQIPLRPEDIKRLVALAREIVGITIDDRKSDFLTGRLFQRLAANGLTSYADYCRLLESDVAERTSFGEALTTHTTSFFREKAQYDWLLNEGLPELDERTQTGQRELLIWSAACSSGQEGYTALMVAQQARSRGLWSLNPHLIGTDVSRPVIRAANQAVYSRQEIEGIPTDLRRRFLLSSKKTTGIYRIVPELRKLATWRQANLDSGLGLDGIAADVIFLRNVLIYFDDEVRARVIDNVYRRLRPGGFLMTGHTEASHARRDGLELVRPSIFRKTVE